MFRSKYNGTPLETHLTKKMAFNFKQCYENGNIYKINDVCKKFRGWIYFFTILILKHKTNGKQELTNMNERGDGGGDGSGSSDGGYAAAAADDGDDSPVAVY